MSLNGAAAVSAFAVYAKQSKKTKSRAAGSPVLAKKQKLPNKQKNKPKTSDRQVNLKGPAESEVKKTSKKLKKLNRRRESTVEEDDEEEPPILVPIQSTDPPNQNGKQKRRLLEPVTPEKSQLDASFTEMLSTLNKTDPSPDGLNLFKWLIAPVTPKDFFERFWEQKPLFIERKKKAYYSHILTTEKLDSIFREYPLYYTRNVDVVTYENGVKELHNPEGRVVASALYDFYSNGCSIRVLNPQTYDQKIHLLIATLQEYFGSMVGTNVYLTPHESQGFAPHYDDIEAFVVQLEGRKHWKLYQPKGSDVLARDSSGNLKHEDIGEPFMKVTLNAGDLLYFPRGTIHEGSTDSDMHSLHLTVSVYQHTAYADLLEHILPDALKRAATENVEFRKGLPVNYLKNLGHINRNDHSDKRATVMNNVKKLMQTLINYVDVDKAADNLGRKFMRDSMPPVPSKKEILHTSKYDGDYIKDGQIFNCVEIALDTEVRLLRYHCLRLVLENDGPKIYYNVDNAKTYHGEEEQVLSIDANLIPVIEKLQNSYPVFIAVEDLPTAENIAKLQVVSDLWELGLLVTNGQLPSASDKESSDDEL